MFSFIFKLRVLAFLPQIPCLLGCVLGPKCRRAPSFASKCIPRIEPIHNFLAQSHILNHEVAVKVRHSILMHTGEKEITSRDNWRNLEENFYRHEERSR